MPLDGQDTVYAQTENAVRIRTVHTGNSVYNSDARITTDTTALPVHGDSGALVVTAYDAAGQRLSKLVTITHLVAPEPRSIEAFRALIDGPVTQAGFPSWAAGGVLVGAQWRGQGPAAGFQVEYDNSANGTDGTWVKPSTLAPQGQQNLDTVQFDDNGVAMFTHRGIGGNVKRVRARVEFSPGHYTDWYVRTIFGIQRSFTASNMYQFQVGKTGQQVFPKRTERVPSGIPGVDTYDNHWIDTGAPVPATPDSDDLFVVQFDVTGGADLDTWFRMAPLKFLDPVELSDQPRSYPVPNYWVIGAWSQRAQNIWGSILLSAIGGPVAQARTGLNLASVGSVQFISQGGGRLGGGVGFAISSGRFFGGRTLIGLSQGLRISGVSRAFTVIPGNIQLTGTGASTVLSITVPASTNVASTISQLAAHGISAGRAGQRGDFDVVVYTNQEAQEAAAIYDSRIAQGTENLFLAGVTKKGTLALMQTGAPVQNVPSARLWSTVSAPPSPAPAAPAFRLKIRAQTESGTASADSSYSVSYELDTWRATVAIVNFTTTHDRPGGTGTVDVNYRKTFVLGNSDKNKGRVTVSDAFDRYIPDLTNMTDISVEVRGFTPGQKVESAINPSVAWETGPGIVTYLNFVSGIDFVLEAGSPPAP